MKNFLTLVQIVLALSVVFVWIFRFKNVVKEFKQFELSNSIRNAVGVSKVSLAMLLIIGIWIPTLVFISSIIMGMFMIAAQYFHFKFKSPLIKRLPSLILLALCAIVAIGSTQ